MCARFQLFFFVAQTEPQLNEAQRDQCPTNKYKTKPGTCGCAVGDIDGDRLEDCVDRHYQLLRYNWALTVPLYAADSTTVGELRLEPNALGGAPFTNDAGDIVPADIR
jgi:hypothetical protein